jgi:hypothetical protein
VVNTYEHSDTALSTPPLHPFHRNFQHRYWSLWRSNSFTHSLTHSFWCKIMLKSIHNIYLFIFSVADYHYTHGKEGDTMSLSCSKEVVSYSSYSGFVACLLSHSSLCVNNPQRCTRYHPLLYKEPQERRTQNRRNMRRPLWNKIKTWCRLPWTERVAPSQWPIPMLEVPVERVEWRGWKCSITVFVSIDHTYNRLNIMRKSRTFQTWCRLPCHVCNGNLQQKKWTNI